MLYIKTFKPLWRLCGTRWKVSCAKYFLMADFYVKDMGKFLPATAREWVLKTGQGSKGALLVNIIGGHPNRNYDMH